MSNTDWLDEILDKTIIRETDDPNRYGEMFVSLDKGKTYTTTKQAILAEIDKAIGEDEEDDLNPLGMMARSTATNRLRAELRTKLGIEKENKDE